MSGAICARCGGAIAGNVCGGWGCGLRFELPSIRRVEIGYPERMPLPTTREARQDAFEAANGPMDGIRNGGLCEHEGCRRLAATVGPDKGSLRCWLHT